MELNRRIAGKGVAGLGAGAWFGHAGSGSRCRCRATCASSGTALASQPGATPGPNLRRGSAANGTQPAGDQGPESLHIVVGHSLLIRTPSRVKRILTGNPTVIESVMTSPQELVVTAKQPGGSSLMLWEETGQNRMLDVFADLDVTPLRNTLDQSFPNSGVDVQSQEDKVMLVGVVASTAVAEQMLKMAANFSKEVVNGLQIAPAATAETGDAEGALRRGRPWQAVRFWSQSLQHRCNQHDRYDIHPAIWSQTLNQTDLRRNRNRLHTIQPIRSFEHLPVPPRH